MISTIVSRYSGTALQFAVLAIIANTTDPDSYGLYILCLSIVFSFYYIVGYGASESAVKEIPRLLDRAAHREVGEIAGSVLVLAVSSAAILVVIGIICLLANPTSHTHQAVAFVAVFLATNGVMFNSSQLLLSIGKSQLAAFFFYPAINVFLIAVFTPAALILGRTSFQAIASSAVLASTLAASIAAFSAFHFSRSYKANFSWSTSKALITSGAGLTAARVLHVVSFWIPTIVTGLLLAPKIAGIIGTAGRLAIAVSAVIAALRFVVRPALSRAFARDDIDYIKSLCGALASVYICLALASIAANELFGDWLIRTFFGIEYLAVKPLLSILLLSVLAEGAFGPVDELLKMMGKGTLVLRIFGILLPLYTAATIFASAHNWTYVPWVQVLYVIAAFAAMNIGLYRVAGYFIRPKIPSLRILKSVK